MKTFAARLKKIRETKKESNPQFTQGYVAKAIGVARTTYTAYENGTKQPPMETVIKLAKLFNTTSDYLYGLSDSIDEESKTSSKSESKDEKFDSFAIISDMIQEFGFEDFGFFDIETWKNLSPEDIDEIRRHFKWIAQQAKERNENDSD